MRTTLDIDDDVLRAAKELARREKKTAGAIISELTRSALIASPPAERQPRAVHGFRPFPKRGGMVTNAQIDKLREEDAF
jgi:hypothetical protein